MSDFWFGYALGIITVIGLEALAAIIIIKRIKKKFDRARAKGKSENEKIDEILKRRK